MGKYDKLLEKLQKEAEIRDTATHKKKCPLMRKPAIYAVVLRGDTGAPVSGVKVDISKPTKQAPTTNGEGEIKVDPAKLGEHGVKVELNTEQKKQFATPQPVSVTTTKERTSIVYFLLEPLPKLLVEVKYKDDNKPVDGLRVVAGRLPEKKTGGGKADFGAVPAGKYIVTVTLDKPLETKAELFHRSASQKVYEPGYTVSWEVEMPYGEDKSFLVLLTRVHWIEFILVEKDTDKPVVGATLHAKLPGGGKAVVTTNETGNARITFAQEGQVKIERVELRDLWKLVKVETR